MVCTWFLWGFFSDIIYVFRVDKFHFCNTIEKACHLNKHQMDKWLINTRIWASSGRLNMQYEVQLGHAFVLLEARVQFLRHVCVVVLAPLLSLCWLVWRSASPSHCCLFKQGVKELSTPLGGEAEGKSKPPIPLRSATSALSNDAWYFFGQFTASRGLIPCEFVAVKSKNMRERSSTGQEGWNVVCAVVAGRSLPSHSQPGWCHKGLQKAGKGQGSAAAGRFTQAVWNGRRVCFSVSFVMLPVT